MPKPSFDEFLTSKWHTINVENYFNKSLSPMELWNIKNGQYLEMALSYSCLNLTFENLLFDPVKSLVKIAEILDVSPKVKQFVNINKSTKNEAGKDYNYYRD